jgi:hypothetical protein
MSTEDLTNQEKLEEVYKLTLENNQILHGMRSRERVANAVRIIYWLIIIGSLVGTYYYVSPLLDMLLSKRGQVDDTLKQFEQLRSQFPETKALQDVLNKIKGTQSVPATAASTTAE